MKAWVIRKGTVSYGLFPTQQLAEATLLKPETRMAPYLAGGYVAEIELPEDPETLEAILLKLADKGYKRVSFRPIDNSKTVGWMAEEHDTPYPKRADYDPRDPYQYWGSGRTHAEAAANLLLRTPKTKGGGASY